MLYDTYAPWEAAEAVNVGKRKKVDVNGRGMWIECSTAGTTGATEPDWYNTLMPEMVTNGTFDTDTSGWTAIRSSTLSHSAGQITVESVGEHYGGASQGFSTEIGKTYTATATIVSATAESLVRITNSATNHQPEIVRVVAPTTALTTDTATFTATATTTYIVLSASVIGNTATFDNISVRLAEPNGTITDNTAECDITPTNYYTYRGPLIEEARTNLCLQSEDFGTTWAETNARNDPDTLNIATSPVGTLSADKLIDDSAGGAGAVFYAQTITVAINTVFTAACYAKADGLNWTRYTIGGLGALDIYAHFDLANGVVGASIGANVTRAFIEDAGNGWFRCGLTFTSDAADTVGSWNIYCADGDGDKTVDFDGTSSIYLWGAQLEAGSAASSYIPTTTAAVTRNADQLSYDTANWFIDTAGTVFVDYLIPQANAALHGILSFTASSLWMYQTAGGASSFRSFDGTSAYNSNSVPINTPTRSALSYGNSVRSSFVNGGNPTTATYDGSWSASNLFIGSNSNGSSQLNGYMLNIIYYQKRLANSVIEANSAREYSND